MARYQGAPNSLMTSIFSEIVCLSWLSLSISRLNIMALIHKLRSILKGRGLKMSDE